MVKEFERTHNGVKVGIKEQDGVYTWTYTNFGSNTQRGDAIDHFHKEYNFRNWV